MYRWIELSMYNAEVARGLVHTEEWKAKMAEEQRLFDEEQTSKKTDYTTQRRFGTC